MTLVGSNGFVIDFNTYNAATIDGKPISGVVGFDPNGEAKLDGLDWKGWQASGKEVNGCYADTLIPDLRDDVP